MTAPDTDDRAYLLAELRAASARARLWQCDIDAIGIALKAGAITVEQALTELQHTGALHLCGKVREQALRLIAPPSEEAPS
jgi:hypothetical protein